ncbi:unnamed protein product [Pylaiella littoralis]
MSKAIRHDPMSAEVCYLLCDDGFNTHFGTQNANECWCSVEPEVSQNSPRLEPSECTMLCASSTAGEHCGGIDKMLVYEITGYQGCHREAFDGLNQQEEPNWFSKSQHEQIIG